MYIYYICAFMCNSIGIIWKTNQEKGDNFARKMLLCGNFLYLCMHSRTHIIISSSLCVLSIDFVGVMVHLHL